MDIFYYENGKFNYRGWCDSIEGFNFCLPEFNKIPKEHIENCLKTKCFYYTRVYDIPIDFHIVYHWDKEEFLKELSMIVDGL
ncbi:hypothetical protein [Providencia phage PSTCR6]|nr:hypothetical protein [Providencia phage PSTCR6]